MKLRSKWFTLVLALAAIMVLGACKKKPVPTPPQAPPPPPAAPTATLSASPDTIQRGQSAQLRWSTENATDITIEGIGAVQASGTQSVSPTASTTYRLVAKGAGGQQEATARVTVSEPPPPPQPAGPTETEEQAFARLVKDVYFDYDSYDIRSDAQSNVTTAAQFLSQHPNLRVLIEGHCDERGSTEYNLALGDNRANAVRDALVRAGVDASRLTTRSFGKERPFCTESNEQCWQQNRRGHFVLVK